MTVDDLAQEIRRVDGNHSLGAGALAEALMPFITTYISARSAEPVAGLTPAEQKAQGSRCSCRGVDDYCPCQNVPDAKTRADRKASTTG